MEERKEEEGREGKKRREEGRGGKREGRGGDGLPNANSWICPCIAFAPQIQRGFPVDIVRNATLLTYLLKTSIAVSEL